MSKHQDQGVTDELLNEKLPLDREPFSEHGELALQELELLMYSRDRIAQLYSRLDEEFAAFDRHDRIFTGHVLLVPIEEQYRLTREISGAVVNFLRKQRKS